MTVASVILLNTQHCKYYIYIHEAYEYILARAGSHLLLSGML